jgi:hypothetical protein
MGVPPLLMPCPDPELTLTAVAVLHRAALVLGRASAVGAVVRSVPATAVALASSRAAVRLPFLVGRPRLCCFMLFPRVVVAVTVLTPQLVLV